MKKTIKSMWLKQRTLIRNRLKIVPLSQKLNQRQPRQVKPRSVKQSRKTPKVNMIKVTNPMMSNQPFQTEKQTKIVPLSQNQTHQQSHQTKTTSMKQPWKRLKPKTIERLQLVPLQQLPQTRRQAKIIPLSRKWTQRQSHQLITRPLKRSRKRPESKKSKAISPLIPSRLSLTQQLTKIVPLIPTSRQPQPHQLLTKRRKPQRKASMSKTPRAITPISGKHPSVTHRLAKILLLSPKLIQRQPHQVTTQPLDQRSKYSQREASKTAKSTPRKQP